MTLCFTQAHNAACADCGDDVMMPIIQAQGTGCFSQESLPSTTKPWLGEGRGFASLNSLRAGRRTAAGTRQTALPLPLPPSPCRPWYQHQHACATPRHEVVFLTPCHSERDDHIIIIAPGFLIIPLPRHACLWARRQRHPRVWQRRVSCQHANLSPALFGVDGSGPALVSGPAISPSR